MKRIVWFLASLALLAACGTRPSEYVDWLYASMPLPDSLQYPRSYWDANVAKTLEVRRDMGWDIPEREFRHFVLPLRVNNETLDDFRTVYADTLCRRVRGMSLSEAALEINHWCHEQATYRPSDARTSGPMATVRRGVGRCGEESVLTVAALRAAGIPARQVYTPRWAHTDDNHAWVEVWVDGKWHFMGACEPAPTLDNAWFNGPVSRALLLHTKVFGDYHGDEDVIQRTPCYTEINVIRGYVPARRTVVTVEDGGRPVEGATVSFHIYNYAEFYPVASYETGPDGQAALDTGLGDMLVWARKGDRFGFAKASGEAVTVSLDHRLGERFSADLDIVPPPEDPIPVTATAEQVAENDRRVKEEDTIRMTLHLHDNPDLDAFLAEHPADGNALLAYLTGKDLGDVTRDVLDDALSHGGTLPDPYVASPRVELEPLRPFRGEVLASEIASRLDAPEAVVRWVRDSIRLIEGRNPQQLRTAPVAVWRARKADASGRDIFFVALCRALGFPARLDAVTGKTQYRKEGAWVDVDLGGGAPESVAPQGTLALKYAAGGPVRTPEYYRHYTLTRLAPEGSRLMEYEEDGPATDRYALDAGYYLLTSGNRLADGSALVHLEFVNVEEGRTTVPLVLRESVQALSVVGTMDPEALFLRDGSPSPQSLLSVTGRGYFLLAVLGRGDEPSVHAMRQLSAATSELEAWGRPLIALGPAFGPTPENTVFGTDIDGKIAAMLAAGAGEESIRLPLVAMCDSFGHIVYLSRGYNTSLASDLRRIIPSISAER